MAETAREREEPGKELIHLPPVYEWAECNSKDGYDSDTKLDAVQELRDKHVASRQAVGAEKKDKVSWCQVEVDVLYAQ